MASAPSDQILEAFKPAFVAAGRPADMAVFTRYDTEGHLQCEVTAYFSPAAADLARAFDARPCSKPAREGLGLLAGEERAWSVLFSETLA
jgi:hypothetical protein